jgi:hypothetical protein
VRLGGGLERTDRRRGLQDQNRLYEKKKIFPVKEKREREISEKKKEFP